VSARLRFYDGKPLSFAESLHYCGCPGCLSEIAERATVEPPIKPDFAAYLRATYPASAHLISDAPTKDRP